MTRSRTLDRGARPGAPRFVVEAIRKSKPPALVSLVMAAALAWLSFVPAPALAQVFERTSAGGSVALAGYRPPAGSGAYSPILDADEPWPGSNPAYIRVTNANELRRALAAAAPGQVIVLADGVYDGGGPFIVSGVRATEGSPLIIQAESRGQAVIAGRSWILVENSSYVVIDGLKFTTTDETTSHGVRFNNTERSRITRSHFALIESANQSTSRHWVYISGANSRSIRIDRNLFEGKRRIGNYISIAGDGVQVAQHIRIDRNYFRDMVPTGANGMEAIRIGVSDLARSFSGSVVEYNLFERASGDAEIISVKSGGNVIRYNTFLESEGAVTFRHGNDGMAYGNYFIGNGKPGTGGIRVYGRRYLIYNNHFEGLGGTGNRSALTIGAGDVADQEVVLNYWPAEHVLVAHNTFVNNRSNINIASGPYPPRDIVFANNVIYSDQTGTLIFEDPKAEVIWVGNLAYAAGRGTLGVRKEPGEIRIADPLVVPAVGGVHVIGERSPAVDASLWTAAVDRVLAEIRTGRFETDPGTGLETDIEGKPRREPFDAGAFERDGWPLVRGPLTPEEVGPWARPARRFSLDVPAVYVTDIRFEGDFAESGGEPGWWGPISVDVEVGVTPGVLGAGEPAAASEPARSTIPVAVFALVDGIEVFRSVVLATTPQAARPAGPPAAGEAAPPPSRASFTINRGELSDGEHVLTVVAELEELKDQVSARFAVRNVRVGSPAASSTVRGRVAIEAQVGIPAGELVEVRVTLDDALIYSGVEPPSGLFVDTLAHADGPHRLAVEAIGRSGARAVQSAAFLVDNFWELSDPLPPPINWGALGELERTQTSAKSSGWRHLTGSQGDFEGDGDRMAVEGGGPEYLIWKAPGLTKAMAIVFARNTALEGAPEGALKTASRETLDRVVVFSASADGSAWQDLPWRVESADRLGSGWHRLVLVAESPGASEFNHFKLAIEPAVARGAAAGDIQLGHVTLWGRRPE